MSDHDTPRPGAGSEDEAYARLQAADPVPDDTFDLTAVRSEVDRRIAETPGTAVTPPPRSGPPRWLQVAAAAAAVALVGSAAFVVGRETGGGASVVEAAAATAAPSAPGFVMEGAPAAGVQGTTEWSGADAQSKVAGGGGRLHFNDGGLSADGGTAEAWAYDPAAVISAATAEKVGAALGLAGPAVVQYQTWTVGATDGSGPSLMLGGDGMASVSYNDPFSYSCDGVQGAEQPADTSFPVGVSCAPDPQERLGDDAAIQRATELLTAFGVDAAMLTLTAPEDQSGDGRTTVIATASLDGLLADGRQQWYFSFVGDRLSNLYGGLAPMISLGEYPVVSPAEAVGRMNDPRFGTAGGPYAIDVGTPIAPPAMPETDPDVVPVPAVPAPGAAIAWPVTEVHLVDAVPSLTLQYQQDGATLLLPAYTMTDDTGGTWTVVAVADDRLDFTG